MQLMHFFLNLFLGGLVIVLVGFLTPGVHVSGMLAAVLAALVYSFFAGLLGGVSLGRRGHGLLAFLVSGLALWLSGILVPGFQVHGYGSALLAVLILGLLQIAVVGAAITTAKAR